jgi:hypothetical protein
MSQEAAGGSQPPPQENDNDDDDQCPLPGFSSITQFSSVSTLQYLVI